ncbi:tyrosine-type recombinase/integrase [Streptomyces sp. NPDC001594]|uniref:tyrosine-type recombinase/integrase n=1 Tax=Streptomyces sp. NPDC001594 TaxID=3364590 RepID=UPI00367B5FCC
MNSALQRRHIKARDEEEPGRVVPLPPNVAFELRRHIKNHGVWGTERLLFPNVTRTGYLYASYFYRQIWLAALTKGEVSYCKPHSMRHYYGSRLLYAGVPENDVADWMGHSSTDVLRRALSLHLRRGRAARARCHRNHADRRCGRPHRARRSRLIQPTRKAPGMMPGAFLFMQVRTRSPPSARPGFPQHDAQEWPGTGPNGPETDRRSLITREGG